MSCLVTEYYSVFNCVCVFVHEARNWSSNPRFNVRFTWARNFTHIAFSLPSCINVGLVLAASTCQSCHVWLKWLWSIQVHTMLYTKHGQFSCKALVLPKRICLHRLGVPMWCAGNPGNWVGMNIEMAATHMQALVMCSCKCAYVYLCMYVCNL